MTRAIFALILSVATLLSASQIDKEIERSKKELQKSRKNLKGLNLKLSKIASEIKKNRSELKKAERELQKLQKELSSRSGELSEAQKRIEQISKNEKELARQESRLKEKLTLLIAKYFSKSLIVSSINRNSQEDFLNEELLKAIKKSEAERISKLGSEYKSTIKKLESERERLKRLKAVIAELNSKRKELESLKKKKKSTLRALERKKREYDKAIAALIREQNSLRETLERLKITKTQKRNSYSKEQNRLKVRNLGNSYQRVKTIRYRGPKTIAPLEKFVITKRYGNYVDPVYNIKIFNESIELKPLTPQAKVKNVLNGRVVLAKRTPHLNNVVIIKHNNGLYTIYAHLDKIAPTIKKGKKVKKGYVIGRVNRKLTFEVTKNRYHINPLQLIKVE